jgi:transposase
VIVRKFARTAATAVLTLGATVGLAAVASAADNGDGYLACNAGEICFAKDDGSTTYQKHFFWGADHANYTFVNTSSGAATAFLLKDNADQVRNRDSSCAVRVIDDRGIIPDDWQDIPNNGNWTTLISSVDNENDRHERRC